MSLSLADLMAQPHPTLATNLAGLILIVRFWIINPPVRPSGPSPLLIAVTYTSGRYASSLRGMYG